MRVVASLTSCNLMCYFCQQHIKFQLKGAEKLSLMILKSEPNFKEKLTFCLKNDTWNFVNFNQSSGKSKKLHFAVLLLSKINNQRMKENRAFRILYLAKNKKTEHKIFLKPQRFLNPLFQLTLFLMLPLFQKYFNPQVRINKW